MYEMEVVIKETSTRVMGAIEELYKTLAAINFTTPSTSSWTTEAMVGWVSSESGPCHSPVQLCSI
jgi:hypothetical protein